MWAAAGAEVHMEVEEEVEVEEKYQEKSSGDRWGGVVMAARSFRQPQKDGERYILGHGGRGEGRKR